jgi:hypothetical protein
MRTFHVCVQDYSAISVSVAGATIHVVHAQEFRLRDGRLVFLSSSGENIAAFNSWSYVRIAE